MPEQDAQAERPPAIGPTVHAVTVLGPPADVEKAWEVQALDTSDLDTEVVFRPATGDKGTEVIVRFEDPDAATGSPLDRLRADAPHQRARVALRRFKSTYETGEVVTTDGQPSGRSSAKESITKAVTDRLREWGAS
jgi:hypothetical protein